MLKHIKDHRTGHFMIILVICAALDSFTHTSYTGSHMMRSIQLASILILFPMLTLILGQQEKEREDGDKDRLWDAGAAFILYMGLKSIRNLALLAMGSKVDWMLLSDQTQLSFFFMSGVYILIGPFIRKGNQRLLLGLSVALAVLIGFLPFNGQLFCAFRIIHFLPFFILGFMVDMEVVEKVIRNYFWALFSLTTLFITALLLYWEKGTLYKLRPLLLGTMNYAALDKYALFGPLLRLGYYPLILLLALAAYTFMPGRRIHRLEKFHISERALQIMYLCTILYLPARKACELADLVLPGSVCKLMYLGIAVVLCFVLGLVNLDFIFKGKFLKRR